MLALYPSSCSPLHSPHHTALSFGVHKDGNPSPVMLADLEACTCDVPIGCLYAEDLVGAEWYVSDCICPDCFRACEDCARVRRKWAQGQDEAHEALFFAPPFGWTAYEDPIADLKSANVSSLLHSLELLEVDLRFNVRSSVVEWSHPSLGGWVAENPR